ncbi:hypothetical protein ACWDRB_58375 [Nonomuraea sp. NPDC003707]
MTAQDTYRSLLKHFITPGMHERSFRGGSGKYYVNGPNGHIGSVLISRNPKVGTRERVSFGIHIGVASRYLQEFVAEKDGAFTRRPSVWSDHDWLDQITSGHLLHADEDVEPIGVTILDIIDREGIPRITDSMTDVGLLRAIGRCPVGVGGRTARLLRQIEAGRQQLQT